MRECGIARIRHVGTGHNGDTPGRPVPMYDHELSWDDGIRCDCRGHRLVERTPPPKPFEQLWEDRQARRRDVEAAQSLARRAAPA